MAEIYQLKLEVTKEQKEDIERYLADKKWSKLIKEVRVKKETKSVKRKKSSCTVLKQVTVRQEEPAQSSSSEHQEPALLSSNVPVQTDRCPYCFMSPCVAEANGNAPWIGDGQQPSPENPGVRKNIYRRFWKIIDDLGGWHIPDYVDKKRQVGGGGWVVYHKREIMPKCVLSLTRTKYPNPKDIPYMGHLWE